jgi:UDP-3-O-acyl-N-acetylglucosamine deacetylase
METPVQISRNRTAFHRELEHVQEEVLVLGSMVEKAVLRSVDALRRRDTSKPKTC